MPGAVLSLLLLLLLLLFLLSLPRPLPLLCTVEFCRCSSGFLQPELLSLPLFFLSLAADLIYVLPFDAPRAFLNSTTGQILYFLFFLFVIAVFGPALIQYFWGCRPLEPGDARIRIEDLCRRAGVSYREIMKWPLFGGGMIAAGVERGT